MASLPSRTFVKLRELVQYGFCVVSATIVRQRVQQMRSRTSDTSGERY